MSGHEKRVDLRFGAFACSVQGFDDPLVPLARVLREVGQTLASTPGEAEAGPMFDEETIRRLEAEIAGAAEGRITAMPGLVLTLSETASGEAAAGVGGKFGDLDGLADAAHGYVDANGSATGTGAGAQVTEPEAGAEAPASATNAELAGTETTAEADGAGAEPPEPLEEEPEAGADDIAARLRAAIADKHGDRSDPDEPDDGAPGNIFGPSDEPDDTPHSGFNMFSEVEDERSAGAGDDALADSGATETADRPWLDDDLDEDIGAVARDAGETGTGSDSVADTTGTDTVPEDGAASSFNIFSARDGEADDEEAPLNLFAEDRADLNDGAAGAASSRDDERDNVTPLIGSYRDLERFARYAPSDDDATDTGGQINPTLTAEDVAKAAGASAVGDLIGASAAWLSLVRGHHSFTRKEVLAVFDGLPGDHSKSLEAKIKGFGRLVRNGQLTETDDSRYKLSSTERDRYEDLIG